MSQFDLETEEELKAAFDAIVATWPDVTSKTMFGFPSYQADGTLFAVLLADGVGLTRLPDDGRDELDSSFETGPFEAGDRTVEAWVTITIDEIADLERLRPYIVASYESALEESGG